MVLARIFVVAEAATFYEFRSVVSCSRVVEAMASVNGIRSDERV
jgi:hypothetical protein